MTQTELRRGVGPRTLRPLLGLTLLALSQICAVASSLEIVIRHTFNGEPLQLGAVRYQNAAGENFSVTRASYLLSGLALERGDGSWLECSNAVAWMDVEKGRASVRVAEVPPGSYRSLRFDIGLDEVLNHADPAQFAAGHPLNPNLNGLHWNWQGGYIFLAVEGMWASNAASRNEPTQDTTRAPSPLNGERVGVRGGNVGTRSQAKERRGLNHPSPLTPLPVEGRGEPEAPAPGGFSFHLARDTNCVRINLAGALDLARRTGGTRLRSRAVAQRATAHLVFKGWFLDAFARG